MTTRPLDPSDRARVEAMTRAVGLFREEEIPVAVEVFEATAAANDTYEGLAALRDGDVVGWISWGPTPGTLGTFDLYWIVIDPACQGQGIGTVLVDEMERRIAGRARLVIVETAGRPDYESTRRVLPAARLRGRLGDSRFLRARGRQGDLCKEDRTGRMSSISSDKTTFFGLLPHTCHTPAA